MCRICDWQSTIVKDLNDSQDPKHTLYCRKNAFVAIYTLFQTTNVPFLPVQGGGGAERGQCHLFLPFFYIVASLTLPCKPQTAPFPRTTPKAPFFKFSLCYLTFIELCASPTPQCQNSCSKLQVRDQCHTGHLTQGTQTNKQALQINKYTNR